MGIVYDTIGNPLSYGAWSYTWKAGRMLHSMVRAGTSAQFTCDHTGLRVKKSVNGVDTLYTLNGKAITHMRRGTTQMHFFYDAQGRPSMIRYNGVDYTYLHNLQGDIVAIIDQEGRSVVEYAYDAWGRPVYSNLGKTCTGSMADTLGVDNPFRYRGYVYDEETGLYYLRSRYYDPVWGRFLNADGLLGQTGELLSHNIFTYCSNNSVNLSDPVGRSPLSAFIAAGLAAAAAAAKVAAMIAKKPGPNGLELMPKDRLVFLFPEESYMVEVKDLITGIVHTREWKPKPAYHTDSWFADDEGLIKARSILNSNTRESYWKKPSSWSKDARPFSVTATDRFGVEREFAVGLILFPHKKTYSKFSQEGEMCMFFGDDTQGYARDHGNEAAMNAYYGINCIVPQRNPTP